MTNFIINGELVDTVIFSPVMVSVKGIHTEVNVTLGTTMVYISYPGGGSSSAISYKTYHIIAEIFTGYPFLQECHEVASCFYLKLIRRYLGEFLFHLLLILQVGFCAFMSATFL